MARSAALAGSLIVHGVIAAIALGLASQSPGPSTAPPASVDIEVVPSPSPASPSPASSSPASPVPASSAPASSAPASSAPASSAPARPARRHAPPAARPARAADAQGTVETTLRVDTGGPTAGDPTGDAAGGAGDAAGEAGGAGGTGQGIGFGAGGGIAGGLDVASLRVPPPPRASRARPARLLYPTREAETDESILFVARLTIDSDGFVVGAHIVHGHGRSLDDEAEAVVWRFRYRPALDDDGRAIRATIEQSFMVE